MDAAEDIASDYARRFGGVERLYGRAGLERLRRAHVCVVGIGGVGSWVVEALARSGVGGLTLVDLDDVCVSNVNRQVPALDGEIGRPKVDVMARRARAIHPGIEIRARAEFFTAATADAVLRAGFDYVCDAIDSLTNKCLLLARCREQEIPVVTTGGAGGRRDPTAVRVTDLGLSSHDGLLQQVRRRLRREHGFPRAPGVPFGVPCVFSTEPLAFPAQNDAACAAPQEAAGRRLNCDSGYGSAAFVTGAFGFAAAAHIVGAIANRA